MPFSQSTYFMKMLSEGLASNYHTSAVAAKSRLGALVPASWFHDAGRARVGLSSCKRSLAGCTHK